MEDSMRDPLENRQRKSFDALRPQMAKAECKPVAESDWRRHIGQTIDRALTLAGVTKQEMSHAMGYQDQSALSRWISGVERPLLDKLFAVDRFYDAWVIACAEANPRIEVTTQILVKSA